jgi:hypothetical protein
MLNALTYVRFEGNNGHDADGPLCRQMTLSGHCLTSDNGRKLFAGSRAEAGRVCIGVAAPGSCCSSVRRQARWCGDKGMCRSLPILLPADDCLGRFTGSAKQGDANTALTRAVDLDQSCALQGLKGPVLALSGEPEPGHRNIGDREGELVVIPTG